MSEDILVQSSQSSQINFQQNHNVFQFKQQFNNQKNNIKNYAHAYLKFIQQHNVQQTILTPQYGQIFISNKQTKGSLQLIHQSKGKLILNITGGKQKIFLFEQVINQEQHIITAIHPQEQDYTNYQDQQTLPIDQIVMSMEGMKIAQIKCGKEHNVIRTVDGKLFSFGKNTFGSLGLGGRIFQPGPTQIRKLFNKKIISVACGFYHSLALSNIGDVYSWGRGFQGQLGLLKQIQTASSPQYISHFYKYDSTKQIKMLKKKPIQYIACGASHSMAIDQSGTLYCWGQARFGQTGNGKKTKQTGHQRKAHKVQGGLGHTLCLTTQGQLFSWGLNIKGQLGLNDLPQGMKNPKQQQLQYVKASYYPVHLQKTRTKQSLPKFKQIACGFCRSFALDIQGNAWCWGGGALGFKDVFANQDSLVLFSPLKLQFFKPSLAPSRGNTQLTFFGFGFTQTGAQVARFKIKDQIIAEVDLFFDDKTSSFYCKTPEFIKINKTLSYPLECDIQISLDRIKYYPYSKKLLIYSQKLSMQKCDPKVGCANGSGKVSIFMPLDQLILSYIQSITVGFKNNQTQTVKGQTKMIDWVCSEGHYKDNNIICKLPNIPQFDSQNPFYLIDISLNGQQFTDYPQTFRFYFINETQINPNQGPQQGQYDIIFSGKGLFDTPSKQLKLLLNFTFNNTNYECSRTVQMNWNKNDKNFTFKMPSLVWMIGDHQISPQLIEQARKHAILVKMYLSPQDSIDVGSFKYTIPPPPVQVQEQKKDSKKDAKKGAKK